VDKQGEGYIGLLESIKTKGLLSAPTVRAQPDGTYELVDGLHRYTALCDLGIKDVTVIVTDLDDDGVLEAQIITNIHRIETKPVEYSQQLRRILARHPLMTESELGVKIGKSGQWVSERLGLNKIANKDVANLIDEGKIVLTNAYALAKLPASEQDDFLTRAMTLTPGEFVPAVNARIKEIREANTKGKDATPAVFEPVQHLRKLTDLKAALEDGSIASKVIAEAKPASVDEAFLLGIKWALHVDPISAADQIAKDQARRADAEAAKARKAAEREAAKAAAAKAAAAKID
jgi:ParB/RepB/Spo0J family partition protein